MTQQRDQGPRNRPTPDTRHPSPVTQRHQRPIAVWPHVRPETLVAIFAAALAVYATIGAIAVYGLRMFNLDGVARIAQAQGVFFSRDPHLGALGFVWPPIPSLTDLLLILPLKPLGLTLLAGPLMSAFYAAFGLAQLYGILYRFELPVSLRMIWLILFGLHPLILHTSVMGLSEAPFMAFLLFSLAGFIRWEQTQSAWGLVRAGIGGALALYCRYEALAWVAGLVAATALVWWQRLRHDESKKHLPEAALSALLVPTVYALVLWIFLNWQIIGNPFNFLVGPGSTAVSPDTAQNVGPSHPYYFAYNSVLGSLSLLLGQVLDLGPLLLPATACLLYIIVRRRWKLPYLLLAGSILGFIFLTAFRGILPHFSRYFVWVVPAGVIVAAAAYHAAEKRWLRLSIAVVTVAALMVPLVWLPLRSLPQFADPFPVNVIGAWLNPPEFATSTFGRYQLDEYPVIARVMDAQPRGLLTLVDAQVGAPLALFLARPEELVITTDQDFQQRLRSLSTSVDQVLVPFPSFDALGRSDVLNDYPDLYRGGEPWAELVREFPGPIGWRLYRIKRP